jgi:dTDP-4-dehydrorhamnose reductase
MRALVVGAGGFIGGYLCRALAAAGHEVCGVYHSRPGPGLRVLDILDREAVRALIGEARPHLVFHPAAVPDVERCEEFPLESYRVNVTGLGHVLEAAVAAASQLVYFSSEYVFDGQAGPYREEDRPNPLSAYGRQKLAGEEMIARRAPGALIIRTTVVYGWEWPARNFIGRLIGELRAGRPVRAPKDQISSPTFVVDLARAACDLAERGVTGLYHVAGATRADRYTFARAAAEVFGLDEGLVTPVLTSDLGQKASRPLSAGLQVRKLSGALGWTPSGFREGLIRMRDGIGGAENEAGTKKGRGQ